MFKNILLCTSVFLVISCNGQRLVGYDNPDDDFGKTLFNLMTGYKKEYAEYIGEKPKYIPITKVCIYEKAVIDEAVKRTKNVNGEMSNAEILEYLGLKESGVLGYNEMIMDNKFESYFYLIGKESMLILRRNKSETYKCVCEIIIGSKHG